MMSCLHNTSQITTAIMGGLPLYCNMVLYLMWSDSVQSKNMGQKPGQRMETRRKLTGLIYYARYYFMVEARRIMPNETVEPMLPYDPRLPSCLIIRLTQRPWLPAAH